MKHKIIIILATLILSGCANKPSDIRKISGVPEIFPDYTDVTIPSDIAPLNFSVTNAGKEAERVDVTIKGSKGGEIHTNGEYADFGIVEWKKLTHENQGGKLTVSVTAKIDGEWLRFDDFVIYISTNPLEQWGLTYRRIAPGYEVYSKMGIYQRDLSNFEEFTIIENTMTNGQCYNCHTSNRTDPRQSVMHVRGEHGATMIRKDEECTWLKANNDALGGSMVYPYWHPSGRYCAFSTNQTRQGFHISGDKRLEVFDLSSDLLVYDTEKNLILQDSLISTRDWSENTPVFSPDGKWLYFTTAYGQEYPMKYKDQRYNLCRIAFDEASGRFGSQVDTLFNASGIGKSVTWPRPSYDGKYIMFTLCDYGYFSIWHKESDQWLLDTATGESRPIDEINSEDADSFHNWSDNSKWVVFTSRRHDGLYSLLYITGIDENGNFSKPFLLPQKNPKEYYSGSLYSFNTPDFTKIKVDSDSREIVEAVLSDERISTQVE